MSTGAVKVSPGSTELSAARVRHVFGGIEAGSPEDHVCPKCNKPGWYGGVTRRHSLKGLDRQTYLYQRWHHYHGSRKSITFRALKEVLEEARSHGPLIIEDVMARAKRVAVEKTTDCYIRIPSVEGVTVIKP